MQQSTEREVSLMAKGKYEKWLKPEGLLKIEGWARDGLTNEQIAEKMGISRKTLQEWCVKYGDICDTLKKGKEIVDREVENALLERAIGGVHKVKKNIKVKKTYYDDHGRKCEKEEIKEVIDEIYTPGDTTAQIFWLKNRKPDMWKDKQSMEISGLAEEQSKLHELLEQRRMRRGSR